MRDVDVVAVAPEGRDGALVTVAAVVAGESRYLAIPVLRRDGELALAGAPAEVGAPLARPVEDLSLPGGPVDDPALEEVVTRALTSYLAGDADGLAADLLPGVVVNTPDRRLRVERLDEIAATAPGRLWAAVTVVDRSGAVHRFVYPLRVEQSGGRWFVAAINQPNP